MRNCWTKEVVYYLLSSYNYLLNFQPFKLNAVPIFTLTAPSARRLDWGWKLMTNLPTTTFENEGCVHTLYQIYFVQTFIH